MRVDREIREYELEYGNIPNDQMGRITHILGKRANDVKFNQAIGEIAEKIKKIKWLKMDFIMYKIVKPSPRPRLTRRGRYTRVYVPGAQENAEWFRRFLAENDLPVIHTPCYIKLKIYRQTPKAWSIRKRVLAELGLIRPWNRTGDFDNYEKTVADQIQHGLLSDDCLIIDSHFGKYYSIKPRAEVEIKFMATMPEF